MVQSAAGNHEAAPQQLAREQKRFSSVSIDRQPNWHNQNHDWNEDRAIDGANQGAGATRRKNYPLKRCFKKPNTGNSRDRRRQVSEKLWSSEYEKNDSNARRTFLVRARRPSQLRLWSDSRRDYLQRECLANRQTRCLESRVVVRLRHLVSHVFRVLDSAVPTDDDYGTLQQAPFLDEHTVVLPERLAAVR